MHKVQRLERYSIQVCLLWRLGVPREPVPKDVLQVCSCASGLLHQMYIVLPYMLVLVLQTLRLCLQHTGRPKQLLCGACLIKTKLDEYDDSDLVSGLLDHVAVLPA